MLSLNVQSKKTKKTFQPLIIASLLTLGLSACDDNDDPVAVIEEAAEEIVEEVMEKVEEGMPVVVAMEYDYTITVTNLTYAQPLSPIAVSLHDEGKMWEIGSPASVALEKLAEGGDNSDFIALENNVSTNSTDGPLMPGTSVSIDITTSDESGEFAKYLTIATMLVNTNDAFSGLTGVDISTLSLNEEKMWSLNVYDAGTEANSEAAGTIPGPADGGTGYDAEREDSNVIAYHSGVVSKDDGLSNSVLTQDHRFDNPAVKVTITRTK